MPAPMPRRSTAIGFLFLGFAIGASTQYLLDPRQGRRRRAMLNDQFVHFRHQVIRQASKNLRDRRNRAQGVIHDLRDRLAHARLVRHPNLAA